MFCYRLQIQVNPPPTEILPPTNEQPEVSANQVDDQQHQLEEQPLEPSQSEAEEGGQLQEQERQEPEVDEEEEEADGEDRYDLLFLPFRVSYRQLEGPSRSEDVERNQFEESQSSQLEPDEDVNESDGKDDDDDYDGDDDDSVPLHKMSAFDYVECWLGPETATAMLNSAPQPSEPGPSAVQVFIGRIICIKTDFQTFGVYLTSHAYSLS